MATKKANTQAAARPLPDPAVIAKLRADQAGGDNYAYSCAIEELDAATALTPAGVLIKLERLKEFLMDAAEGVELPFAMWSATAGLSESINRSLTRFALEAYGIT